MPRIAFDPCLAASGPEQPGWWRLCAISPGDRLCRVGHGIREVGGMKTRLGRTWAIVAMFVLSGCGTIRPPWQRSATVTVMFDLAGGGSGFSLSVYAQEVRTGKTYYELYSSGAHGGVILPTSGPLTFSVDAPGTYIFYANMINAPEDYHFGATGCGPGPECASSDLKAIDVSPGHSYEIYFSDRSGERHAPVPTPHAPVTVPWQR